MKNFFLNLPFGIEVVAGQSGAKITSKLAEYLADGLNDAPAYAAADAIERLLLAMAAEGVDLGTPKMEKVIKTTVEAVVKNLDEINKPLDVDYTQELLAALEESLGAWVSEEESVQEEHSDMIERTHLLVDRVSNTQTKAASVKESCNMQKVESGGLFLGGDETATVLAALRFYQQNGQGEPANRSDAIHAIATNDGEVFSSLDDEGIDKLCEMVNLTGSALENKPLTTIVVVLEGGQVRSVLSADGGLSVAVIEYDKNVGIDDGAVLIPQDSGIYARARAGIHQVEVDGDRAAAIYAASEKGPTAELAEVVTEGIWCGEVTAIKDGVVTHKVNRDGKTVKHDGSALSAAVSVGDVVDVQYRGGRGEVKGVGKAAEIGR